MTTAKAVNHETGLPIGGPLSAADGSWFTDKYHAAATRVRTPSGLMALLILGTLVGRLLFAASLGLGIDESYMVAAGRNLHLSYFDHPPLAWWAAWGSAHLLGTDAPLAVRLPFVLIFAASTWLMFRLTAELYGDGAGFWAALLLNLSPVFGVTTGSWVLPDGPLMAALLAAAICLLRAIRGQGRAAWGWWLGAGGCSGLAMMSKYSAVLTIAGAIFFLLTQESGRRWLSRPHPYLAGLVALAVFSPVLVWNAEHGWASLAFQGRRAGVGHLHVFGPLSTLGGEALFLLPWIWLPLIACGLLAVRRGPQDRGSWLLACLAFPTILTFLVVSLWNHVLFHWAAPGYLMLFPLLGHAVERNGAKRRANRWRLSATAALVICGVMLVASEVRLNWLPHVIENFSLGSDPDLDAVDWTSVPADLAGRGLLDGPTLVVAATRWLDAGKIDYALEGQKRVICLGSDPREYGLIARPEDDAGHDVLIIAPRTSRDEIDAKFGASFDFVEELPPALLRHAERPAMLIPLFLGHHLHVPAMRRLDS